MKRDGTFWANYEHGEQVIAYRGHSIVGTAVVRVPTEGMLLTLQVVRRADNRTRSVTFDAFDCLLATPGSTDKAIQIDSEKLVEPGNVLVCSAGPEAIVCLGHRYADEGRAVYMDGNYGVEIDKEFDDCYRLSFCEGMKSVRLAALVIRLGIDRIDAQNLPDFASIKKVAKIRPRVWPNEDYPGMIRLTSA